MHEANWYRISSIKFLLNYCVTLNCKTSHLYKMKTLFLLIFTSVILDFLLTVQSSDLWLSNLLTAFYFSPNAVGSCKTTADRVICDDLC